MTNIHEHFCHFCGFPWGQPMGWWSQISQKSTEFPLNLIYFHNATIKGLSGSIRKQKSICQVSQTPLVSHQHTLHHYINTTDNYKPLPNHKKSPDTKQWFLFFPQVHLFGRPPLRPLQVLGELGRKCPCHCHLSHIGTVFSNVWFSHFAVLR